MSESAKDKAQTMEQPATTSMEAEQAKLTLVPATFRGMPPTAQTFWAVVSETGALIRNFGAVGSVRLGVGLYVVQFSHDVTGSAYVATQGFTGSVGVPPPGQITVVGRFGLANGVLVATYDTAFALVDRAFHLAVHS